jgi:anti-sigma factor RsiW
MNCAEISRFVHVDMDGELDAEDRIDLEQHLSGCAACAEVARKEREFVGRLRETLRTDRPVAPPALAARVDRALDEVGRRRTPVQRMAVWGVVAAAAAMLLVVGLRTGDQRTAEGRMQGLMGEAVARHQRELPIEVSGPDPNRIGSWFRGKLDLPVRPPALRPVDAQLLGGRLSHLGERQAALLTYDVGGSKFSVFIFDPRNMATDHLMRRRVQGRDVYVGGAKGYRVAVVNEGGLGYAFASDLDEARMLDVIASIFPR